MTANAYPFGKVAGQARLPGIGRKPHRTRASRVVQFLGFAAAIGCHAAVAQTPGAGQQVSAITEIACPRGTQVLVLLQSASGTAYVTVDEIPEAGPGDAKRLDARTVAPQDMPNTLELTQVVGDKDVFVSVLDRAPNGNDPKNFQSRLDGYIGCGAWQARILGSQLNAFLLKRTAAGQPAPEANVAPAPNTPPGPTTTPPPVVQSAPPASETRRNEPARTEINAQRIASEIRAVGLPGIWAHSCDRSPSYRDIFVDRSGHSFWRASVPDAPSDRFKREIIDFQKLSANRFQITMRGRYSDEENAVITSRYSLLNNLLFVDDVRTASGRVSVERGRFASGRFQGQAVPGLMKCRGPRMSSSR